MGEFKLNLSTRPFPAYRLANIGLFLLFIILAGVSMAQVYYFQEYSGKVKDIRAEEQRTRVDRAQLGKELDELSARLDRPVTTAKLTEIDFLNSLITRKRFSWTQVFANLEGLVPESVHLNGLTPEILKDKVILHMEITCRSNADESEFIRRLQASPVFQDVNVAREELKGTGAAGENVVILTVAYFPERLPGDFVSPGRAPIAKKVSK